MISLESLSAVCAVRPTEEEAALAPLVLAFANDPAIRWMYPDAHQFRLFFPRFVRAFAGKAFTLGTAQRIKGFRGTALWLAPGVGPDESALVALVRETVAGSQCHEVLALLDQLGAMHPAEPHWYLPLIGIDPRHQGQGLGSMLLERTLAPITASGAAVYLEASNPRNIPFYERHGFELCGEIQAGSSPTLFAMLRAPR